MPSIVNVVTLIPGSKKGNLDNDEMTLEIPSSTIGHPLVPFVGYFDIRFLV